MSENENQSIPPAAPPPAAPPPPVVGAAGAEERQWAMFAHLASLTGLVTGGIGNVVGPLVVWLIKKESMPFVDDQGKEALNFNITVWIIGLALMILTFVTLGLAVILTVPLGICVFIAWLVLTIVACMKTNEGETYRYPFTLRLIK